MNVRHLLLTSLALAASAAACGHGPEATAPKPQEATGTPIRVETVEVHGSSGAGDLEIPGAVESSRRAVLSSRLSASIVELKLHEGDVVKAGQTLVRLSAEALSAAVSAAEVRDEAATRDLNRAEALLAKGAATRNEVENATTAAAGARAALTAAREALFHTTIRAPFGGRIAKKLASVGDTVNPGTPLLEIEGEGGLEVVASVESAVHERLAVGRKLKVRIDGVDAPVTATVRTLAASADSSTHRFTLRADVPSAPGIRAGLYARIAVPFPGAERRLLIPEGAILRRGGLTGVYVIREGRAWLRWIAPGDTFGDSVEARAGLEGNERVALEPARLQDGVLVTEDRQ
jgi:RND family efflux transporter MFP subunit